MDFFEYYLDLFGILMFMVLLVVFTHTVAAIVSSMIHYSMMGWTIRDYFRYFTTLSNLLTALAAVFIIPFANTASYCDNTFFIN